jgi:tripartite-type tricarboxylate transporter receptor subunit TctC
VREQYKAIRLSCVTEMNWLRSRVFPQLPTLREEGVPDYDVTAWFASYFARGTPPEIAAAKRGILRRAVKEAVLTETLAMVRWSRWPCPARS